MIQYFKKYSPQQAIIFSDGSGFRGFQLVNNEVGILATGDPRIIREIEACIAGHRGGAEKITSEEFLSLQSQKKSNLQPPWREEWQPRKLPPTASGGSLSQPSAAATEAPAPRPVPPADGEKSFRPKTSKSKS